jgi:cytochrome subunit of sulfide dehydrogenase
MRKRVARAIAGLMAVSAVTLASGQQPPPPAPAFAAPSLTDKGVAAMAANCAACHGTRGTVVSGSTVASLAGKPAAETVQSMAQFKAGTKPATIMHQIAKGYSDAEIAAIAAYFASQRR